MKYAGFWIRVGATLIDGFILMIPVAILQFVVYMLIGPGNMGYTEYLLDETALSLRYEISYYIASLALFIPYYGILTSKYQGTPGKLMLGLRVIGEDGYSISIGRSILRYFAYIPASILYIGYIMVGLTEKKQGLHDMICKTYVIKN